MPYPVDPVKLAAWSKALDASYAQRPNEWNKHDTDMRNTVADYNLYLAKTPGFFPLDWTMAKALSWVETGPNAKQDAWNNRVMQIGNQGDPGMDQMLNQASGKLLVPPQYRPYLTASAIRSMPLQNMRAGVGYMFWCFAIFGFNQVPVPEPAYSVVSAKQVGAHPPPKTKPVYAVTAWRPMTLALIAARYNVGDGNYFEKLRHAYNVALHGLATGETTQ